MAKENIRTHSLNVRHDYTSGHTVNRFSKWVMKDPKLSNVEALKVPMFYVWNRLYGHTHTLSPRGTSAYWLASFKTSPPEYLSECMRLLREGEIPYVDIELRNSLINFYSELAEAYSI